jgi:hypothetical protein
MSKIHISRNRQSLGHFYPGEVAMGLRTGRFLPTDLAWQDPMETWKPLAEFTDLPVIESEPEGPPPLPETTDAPSSSEGNGPAWDAPGNSGGVRRLFTTIGQVFSQPSATFRGLADDRPIGRALGYYLIIATLATWVSSACNLAVMLLFPQIMEKSPLVGKMTPSALITEFLFGMITTPFFLAGMAFVAAGVLQLLLRVFGVSQPMFSRTIRVYCYAAGTAFVLMLIPACGPLLFLPCYVFLLVLGLKEAHRSDAFRPAVAVSLFALGLLALYVLLLVAVQTGLIK